MMVIEYAIIMITDSTYDGENPTTKTFSLLS